MKSLLLGLLSLVALACVSPSYQMQTRCGDADSTLKAVSAALIANDFTLTQYDLNLGFINARSRTYEYGLGIESVYFWKFAKTQDGKLKASCVRWLDAAEISLYDGTANENDYAYWDIRNVLNQFCDDVTVIDLNTGKAPEKTKTSKQRHTKGTASNAEASERKP